MSKKAISGIILTLLLIEMSTLICDSSAVDNLELEITVSNTTITIGEEINITLTLRNIGTSNVTIQYIPPLFDAYYCTPDDCFRWSVGKPFPPTTLSLKLEPGESHTETVQWNLYQYVCECPSTTYYPPDPGTYDLWGTCPDASITTPSPVAVTLTLVKTLLGTGEGWMRIESNQSVCGNAGLYKIGDEQMELVIACEGGEYSRTWDILSREEYNYSEIFQCYSTEWGYLTVGIYDRRWYFWWTAGTEAIAIGFPRLGRLILMPI